MSFLYPIEPQIRSWEPHDYAVHFIRITSAPLASLVALPFFLLKRTKDSFMFFSCFRNLAEQRNELSRDCRKIRFYAKRLIPLIGYYWGHRSEERREKYEALSHLSIDRLEALAFKRTRASKKPILFQRETKLIHMILAVSENSPQIEAILRGINQSPEQSRNYIFSHLLRNFLVDPNNEKYKTCAVSILRYLVAEGIDLHPITAKIYPDRLLYLFKLAEENQILLKK